MHQANNKYNAGSYPKEMSTTVRIVNPYKGFYFELTVFKSLFVLTDVESDNQLMNMKI